MKIKRILILILIILVLASCNSPVETHDNHQERVCYDISNDYFNYKGHEIISLYHADLVNNTTTVTPAIKVVATCNYSLVEVSVSVRVYTDSNTLLLSFEDSKMVLLDKGEEFDFHHEITHEQYLKISYLVVEYNGTSEEKPDPKNISYTVTFVSNNGSNNQKQTVKKGATISKPSNPTKTNYIFSAWYIDKELTVEYDFSKPVTENLTLYAGYIVDYAKLTNLITTKMMKCNVTVYTKSYNTFLGITTSNSTSSGSGIIFYESSSYYYFITNNHVSVKKSGYDKVSYTVEDYLGNTYTGTLKYQSATYDLAVIYFKKGSTKLGTIDLAAKNSNAGDEIVAIGQPKGQSNSITYGKIERYLSGPKLDCETYRSNVTFTVLRHNAETNGGSSGGALLNMDLKLIGIHYAGSRDSSGNFICGYAIPIDKIHDFLNKYIWGK